ncbi:oxidoreductase [Abeliophyllum distichum]|uniref:Oxidoreductase n=1 Tax=Abeliophyllum distichum TaxID=126358 RepID=A0ABD1SGC3_9LAMI
MKGEKAIQKMKAIDADVLQVREVEKPKIGDDQVLIEVAATSVNWADLWKRADFRGKVRTATSPKPNLGLECSGRIVEVGSQVTRWKIGDEVCGIVSGGGYAELVAVCDKLVIPIPMGIPLRDAAALPLSACLIWHCFFRLNRVRQDQIILIHRAAGGVGSLAIQILKYYGCHVYITAGGNSLSLSPAEHATLLNDVEKNIWPAIAQQRIRPIIYKSFKFIEAAGAHTAMQKSINLGKVLLLPIFHGEKHQSWNTCSCWLCVWGRWQWKNGVGFEDCQGGGFRRPWATRKGDEDEAVCCEEVDCYLFKV